MTRCTPGSVASSSMVINGFIFYDYINIDSMHSRVSGFIIYGYQWISSYINDPMHSRVGGFIIYSFQWIYLLWLCKYGPDTLSAALELLGGSWKIFALYYHSHREHWFAGIQENMKTPCTITPIRSAGSLEFKQT